MYEYNAYITRIVDGDTFICNVDLGFNIIKYNEKIRLSNVDTPEIYKPINEAEREHGHRAKDFVTDLIYNKHVIIRTEKDKKGKYGRMLADVVLNYNTEHEELLSEVLKTSNLIKLSQDIYLEMEGKK